jgi:DHA1 family tetracycline resistance protein-like MFS transporter
VLICVFIDMLGIGLIVPVLPLLVGQFVHTRETQAHWFGILSMTFGLLQFLCMPMLGAISDRIGRRPVLMYSMAGMCLNFLITAWAPNLAFMFLGRIIGGMSSASMSVASAYASDVSTHENRSKSFGKVGAAFGLGFICGPALGGLLGEISLKLPFMVAAALCAANFAYGYFFVPESLAPSLRQPFSVARLNPFTALIKLARRVEVRGLVVVFALSSLAQMMLQSINSIGIVFMPLLGTAILGKVSHFPASDWRIGSTFFVCAAMQTVAVLAAARYFKSHHYKV